MKKEAIRISGLSKEYPGHSALSSITLSVPQGEFFGLFGPNGSGKTTMIRIMTGQIKPSSGTVQVFGVDAEKEPIKVREICGIIPEQENPPSFLTAEEYLHFVGKVRKIEGIKEKAERWFSLLEFEDQKDILCKDLSRGTRQKLMFSQAFIHAPKVAFIDEPLINLDPQSQRKVKDFLLGYVKKGNTLFFSTHNLEIAEELCTHIAIINKGKLLFSGSMKDIKKKKTSLEAFFLRLIAQ